MSDTVRSQVGPWALVPVWVLSVGLTGAELATYVALRSFADRGRDAYPRVATIAERAGVNVKTAEKAISRFRALDLLTTTRRYRDDGSIAGCDYHLADLAPDGNESAPEPAPAPTEPPPADEPAEEVREDVERLCNLMADLVEGNGSKRPTITKAWRDDARRMLDLDKRDLAKAEELMRWTAADPFWRANVLSIPTFRKKYDALRLRAVEEWERNRPAPATADLPSAWGFLRPQQAAARPNSAENRLAKARQIAADLLARQEQQQAPALATPDYLQITNGSDQ